MIPYLFSMTFLSCLCMNHLIFDGKASRYSSTLNYWYVWNVKLLAFWKFPENLMLWTVNLKLYWKFHLSLFKIQQLLIFHWNIEHNINKKWTYISFEVYQWRFIASWYYDWSIRNQYFYTNTNSTKIKINMTM